MSTHIYLVPGFLGFRALGGVSYFRRVPETLRELLAERGLKNVTIGELPTLPSGSIARRSQIGLKWMVEQGGHKASSIHLIGHSTGGLDARLIAAPGVRLLPGNIEETVGSRIRSVTTISTPHFGTPMADLLLVLPFRQLLEKIGMLGTTRNGRAVVLLTAQVLGLVARLDDFLGRTDTFLDVLVERILKRVTKQADDPMWEFMREMSRDQGAAVQLTLASMHVFNAAVADRTGTQYSCVITAAPPPPTGFNRGDFLSPAKALSMLAFWVLYGMSSRASKQYPYMAAEASELNLARFSAPIQITPRSNDGIVPCQSQAYGKILDVVLGDHLDVVGQFPGAGGDAHADWLPCGADFNEERFRQVWSAIAGQIVEAEASSSAPRSRRASKVINPARPAVNGANRVRQGARRPAGF